MRPLRDSIESGVHGIERADEGKFNAKVVDFEDGTKGILKERLHSNEHFRGVSKDQFHVNEAAFYDLNRMLRFDVIPETIWTVFNGHPASVQRFVYGKHAEDIVPDVFDRTVDDWKLNVINLASKMSPSDTKKIVVLDLLMNSTDRHPRNFLISDSGRVWGIDNGICGAPFMRYYQNVLHSYFLRDKFRLTPEIEKALRRVTLLRLKRRLAKYGVDYETVWKRLELILLNKDDLSFRRLSRGNYGKDDFPSYRRELSLKEDRAFPFIIEQPEGSMAKKYH